MNTSNFIIIISAIIFSSLVEMKGQESNLTSINHIPFELTDHNNISIEAILNGADTLDLMFHTAAGSVTITTEAIEKLSKIKWDTEEEVNSWGGKSSARYSHNNFLEISNLKWDSIEIWETTNSGPTTDGKFGPNLFKGEVVIIDFEEGQITLQKSLPKDIQEYVKTPLIYENGFMFLEGISTINGSKFSNRFLIHSGYGSTILYDDKFVSESKIGEEIEIIDENELKDSYGNVIKTKKGILPEFTIGEVAFNNIPVGFFEGAIGRQQMSVMGGDLIKRFNIIIDAERAFIYLRRNGLYNLSYTEF